MALNVVTLECFNKVDGANGDDDGANDRGRTKVIALRTDRTGEYLGRSHLFLAPTTAMTDKDYCHLHYIDPAATEREYLIVMTEVVWGVIEGTLTKIRGHLNDVGVLPLSDGKKMSLVGQKYSAWKELVKYHERLVKTLPADATQAEKLKKHADMKKMFAKKDAPLHEPLSAYYALARAAQKKGRLVAASTKPGTSTEDYELLDKGTETLFDRYCTMSDWNPATMTSALAMAGVIAQSPGFSLASVYNEQAVSDVHDLTSVLGHRTHDPPPGILLELLSKMAGILSPKENASLWRDHTDVIQFVEKLQTILIDLHGLKSLEEPDPEALLKTNRLTFERILETIEEADYCLWNLWEPKAMIWVFGTNVQERGRALQEDWFVHIEYKNSGGAAAKSYALVDLWGPIGVAISQGLNSTAGKHGTVSVVLKAQRGKRTRESEDSYNKLAAMFLDSKGVPAKDREYVEGKVRVKAAAFQALTMEEQAKIRRAMTAFKAGAR